MISLREITPGDKNFFLKTYNDKSSRYFMEDDRIIIKKWYPYIGGKPNSLWLVIENEKGVKVGLFNSFIKEEKPFWGIIICKSERRKGYAKETIQTYLNIIDKKSLDSYIECFENNPAIKLYKKFGYVEIDEPRIIREFKFLRMVRKGVNK